MQEKTEKICQAVLKTVTPEERERAEIELLTKNLEKKVASASERLGVEAEVRVEGSVAKDTWLSGEPDIDIFMRVPPTMPRKSLGDVCLKVARQATKGSKQIERFAEHPYLEAIVENVRVNIVPCYKVRRGEWLSATDRTPFHTDYVRKHLKEQMRGEVRLLKRFMKGVDVYGAEIKVGGFSGYLCELLILNFETFTNTLEAFAQYKQKLTIDNENYYKGREHELQLLFKDLLIIVDPVDKGRNVASAVRPQKLYTFIAAAREFLKNPNTSFFYPQKTTVSTVKQLRQILKNRGSTIIVVAFRNAESVPDILWGQLYKSQRSLHKLVQLKDFAILRDLPWSDEENLNMFIFELEQRFLSPIKKHWGPPLEKKNECDKFLVKHLSNIDAVSGPHIENGRWVVELRRKTKDAVTLFNEKLKDGGRKAGIAQKISQALSKGFEIFVDDEIAEVYKKNSKFAEFLTEFLAGKPKWLELT